MNKQQNANAKVTKTVLLVMAVLVICTGSAIAQPSLRNLAQENGADWLAGQWKATTDDGTEILLSYRWVCDGHAVVVDFKMGDYLSHSMIYYIPDDEKATEIGIDNKGGRAKGTWEIQGEKLVAKSEMITADGERRKSGVVYSKLDDKTMKVSVYGLNDYNELNDEPWFTAEFKRRIKKTEKTADK
ncbi:MAG: hypothetical protein JW837_16875 [Sedimentisphaerales bacterium]|nr:hypothetical protein [Sedimentisphaerales bacterium]